MAIKVVLFDPETEGSGSIDLEDGKYTFKIEAVETTTAKSGRGRLQIRLSTLEGPVVGGTAFDWWNLPEATDKATSYIKNFWKDATKAWPFIYVNGVLNEDMLKGQTFRATVSHEERKDKEGNPTGDMVMRIKSHKFQANTTGGAPLASVPAAAPGGGRPAKFGQP